MSETKATFLLTAVAIVFFVISEIGSSSRPVIRNQTVEETSVGHRPKSMPDIIVPGTHPRILLQSGDYTIEKKYTEGTKTQVLLLKYNGLEESIENSKIIRNLKMIITFHPKDIVRIKILDADDPNRWEIPEKEPFPFFKDTNLVDPSFGKYEIVTTDSPFSLKVIRKDNNQVIFDTTGRKFIYSDLYIEFGGEVPSNNIFGYGERFSKFKLDHGTYTIWGRDEPIVMDRGESGGNVYGHHPVGLIRDKKGSFFVMLMKNSNAMDIVIENERDKTYLTHKIVGGVIDLLFFAGDQYPDTALVNYHEYIGKFVMMPFWSLGYHQCRWGYRTQAKLEEILNNFAKYELPIDTIWSDIDYMIEKEDFTINSGAFPTPQMHSMFERHRVHYVPIIDAGIKKSGFGANEGLSRKIFVKNQYGDWFSGSVWPGAVYFVDFFHPDAEKYWSDMLDHTWGLIHYSGIWLDMNEIANFENGEQNRPSTYDRLPYTPGRRVLRTKTLSLESVHYGNILELNVHELHSILQNKATYYSLKQRTPLPFILTRSSSFGTGQYSAHWTGDNGAGWDFLKVSIGGNFNFQIFGQPFVGADICGFMGDTNAELCARWIQLGALYPFSRNHNQDISRDQEPWVFEHNVGIMGQNVLPTYRESLKFKYSIMKWFYTQYIERNGAGSIWKPLFFEFPNEEEIYKIDHVERQFMIGRAMMFVPATNPGLSADSGYFPKARWFDFLSGKEVINENAQYRQIEVPMPFRAPCPAFIRGGHIVHTQNVDKVFRTDDLGKDFILNIAFGSGESGKWEAEGTIMGIQTFSDQNVYDKCVKANCLYKIHAKIDSENYGLTTIHVRFENADDKVTLEEIGIHGFKFYGLPIAFLAEDDLKVGFAVAELFDKTQSSKSRLNAVSVESKFDGSFNFSFEKAMNIKTGDFFKIQILV